MATAVSEASKSAEGWPRNILDEEIQKKDGLRQ